MPGAMITSAGQARGLFYGQNGKKSRNIEDFHNTVVDMRELHRSLIFHYLLQTENYAQPGGGYIVKFCAVKDQFLHAVKIRCEFGFKLRCGGRIQTARKGNGQFAVFFVLLNGHVFPPISVRHSFVRHGAPIGIALRQTGITA